MFVRRHQGGSNMLKVKKIVLGIMTLWPITYMLSVFVFKFSSQSFQKQMQAGQQFNPPAAFKYMMGLHLFTMLWIIVLL